MNKKLLMPLAVILITALGLRWLSALLKGQIAFLVLTVLRCILLFWFGLTLNTGKRKRHETWLRKVIISFVMIFFLVWELGYIMIPELKNAFDLIGISGAVVYLVYIYCGWSFFD
ncbi:MAG: hypothetical protein IKF46_07615 [Erysipelotrichaceae bacterium]|nr:hypothetical protein [Erysipelotrichaceae bacterium]